MADLLTSRKWANLASSSTPYDYEYQSAGGESVLISIENVGENPAALSLSSGPTMDPDAPSGDTNNEILLPAGKVTILPKGIIRFIHKSTTGTFLNVIVDVA